MPALSPIVSTAPGSSPIRRREIWGSSASLRGRRGWTPSQGDHPYDGYEGLKFEVPVEDGGDVRARLMVRAREVEQSLAILHQVLDRMPETPLTAPGPREVAESCSPPRRA